MPFLFLGLLVLLQSCTGQSPAELKNSTTPKYAVKGSCSDMVFEGQVLSKKNILNIFDCSGWAKQYPELSRVIKSADAQTVDRAFKLINETFFSDRNKRKSSFNIISRAQSAGEMDSLSSILEESLLNHDLIGQIERSLKSKSLTSNERAALMKIVSSSNEENTKVIKGLKNTMKSYEDEKRNILATLDENQREKLIAKAETFITELSGEMDEKSWKHVSGIFYSGDSAIQDWAKSGVDADLNILLKIVENPTFYKDVTYLKDKIDHGITCENKASQKIFVIDVGQELKHIIESLKNDEKPDFEKTLLHGLTKYLAFQEFCEEKERKQGVDSFFQVLNHAFNAVSSEHDYQFLKRIHQIFKEDRFVLLSFLSSQSFYSLRELLVDLDKSGGDEELVRSLYRILVKVPKVDIVNVSELLLDLSRDSSKVKTWYQSWSKLWEGMTPSEKKDLIHLLGVILSEDQKPFKVINLVERIIRAFPDFTPKLAADLETEVFQRDTLYLISLLTEEKVQKELSSFLSEEVFFEFIKIVTKESSKRKEQLAESDSYSEPSVNYVAEAKSRESGFTKVCFRILSDNYRSETSYYDLVNSLPDECLAVLGQVGFVGRIYLWMNASDHFFRKNYQVGDFHSATGVWAPGMLQFIFSSAVKADLALLSNDGKKGIKENLDEIHRVLTHPVLLETFHHFSQIYGQVDHFLDFDQRLTSFVKSHDDSVLSQFARDGLSLTTPANSYVTINIKQSTCQDISNRLGANPCLSQEQKTEDVLAILRILKRKNEKGNSLAQELVKWIHPKGGIELPFRKRKTRSHKTSIDEMIRFLFDLSSSTTVKAFVYQQRDSSEKVYGNILDRLEVVIRDISFVNNFYGAYFKNSVGGAVDYRDHVVDSEKLLVMLQKGGGFFRGTNSLPEDSKHRLKNVRATYSSLIELSDNFLQADGSSRTYGPFIQSLLTAIGNSSKVSTQKFNPYRIPDEEVVEGHNGIFLTKFVEMSGLRHMADFIRSRFDSTLSALESPRFKLINTNLVGRHDLSKIQSALQLVLDKYLDNDRNQLNLVVKDAISLFSDLSKDEQEMLEEIALKSLVLLSDEKLSQNNIERLAEIVDLSIEIWPELSEILRKTKNRQKLFKMINELMDSLVTKPEVVNRVLDLFASSNLLNAQDVKQLIVSPIIQESLEKLINQLSQLDDIDSFLNWHETIEAIISSDDVRWAPIKTWLFNAHSGSEKKLTVSLMLSVLGEKNQNEYRLKMIMDEVFLNHRGDLLQFLTETFKSLELKPD